MAAARWAELGCVTGDWDIVHERAVSQMSATSALGVDLAPSNGADRVTVALEG